MVCRIEVPRTLQAMLWCSVDLLHDTTVNYIFGKELLYRPMVSYWDASTHPVIYRSTTPHLEELLSSCHSMENNNL